MKIGNPYPELKKCPFCGEPAKYNFKRNTGYDHGGQDGAEISIRCFICGAESPKIFISDNELSDEDYRSSNPQDFSDVVKFTFARVKQFWNGRVSEKQGNSAEE